MTSATFTNPPQRPPVVQLRVGRILLLGLGLLLVLGAGGIALFWSAGKKGLVAPVETTTHPAWMKQPVAYAPTETPTKPATDLQGAALRDLQMQHQKLAAELQAHKEALAALKKQRSAVPMAPPSKAQIVPPAPTEPPKKPTPGPMLFVSNKLERAEGTPAPGTHVLAAGSTKIPCLLETKIVSDVEGTLLCRVTTNLYDTATGRYLLVPQGSTIIGTDHANDLLYGSNRMNTRALSLTFPDGRSVALGEAPLTDRQGVAGLTGDVNNHYGKLLGAVLIGGALKGGMTAFQVAAAEAAGAGQVTSGLTTLGNQAATKITTPHINIRPTITIEAGEVATVLLLKPLHLPALW